MSDLYDQVRDLLLQFADTDTDETSGEYATRIVEIFVGKNGIQIIPQSADSLASWRFPDKHVIDELELERVRERMHDQVTADTITDEQIREAFGRDMIARPALVARTSGYYTVTACGANDEPALVPSSMMFITKVDFPGTKHHGRWRLEIRGASTEHHETMRAARYAASRADIRARCAEILNARAKDGGAHEQREHAELEASVTLTIDELVGDIIERLRALPPDDPAWRNSRTTKKARAVCDRILEELDVDGAGGCRLCQS